MVTLLMLYEYVSFLSHCMLFCFSHFSSVDVLLMGTFILRDTVVVDVGWILDS